jgi:hypothetical protein
LPRLKLALESLCSRSFALRVSRFAILRLLLSLLLFAGLPLRAGTLVIGGGGDSPIWGGDSLWIIGNPVLILTRPPIPIDQSFSIRHSAPQAQTFTMGAGELAVDPDWTIVRVTAVYGASAFEILDGGSRVRFAVSGPSDVQVKMEDASGASCLTTLRFTVEDSIFRRVTGYEDRVAFEIPTFGYAREELTVAIVEQGFTGQASVDLAEFRISYGGMNQRIMSDDFRYTISRAGRVIADFTVFIVNVGEVLAGNYQVQSAGGQWVGRVTVQPDGAYTAVLYSRRETIRRAGNFLRDIVETPAKGLSLRLFASTEGARQFLDGVLLGAAGEEDLYFLAEDELGRMNVPRVHALLQNRVVYVQFFQGPQPGVFNGVVKRIKNLPPGYAVIRKGAGASVSFVGKHWDGSAWTGVGYVESDGALQMIGRGVSGVLKMHRRGNISGALQGELPNKERFTATVGGSPFTPSGTNVNVFRGQMTPVRVRSLFPMEMSLPAFVGPTGNFFANAKGDVRVQGKVDSGDGMMSGTVQVRAIGVSRPVHGLFIPHKQMVVGFSGEDFPKSFTMQRR